VRELRAFERLSMYSVRTSHMNILSERRLKLCMLLLPVSYCISYDPSHLMLNILCESIM